MYKLYVMETTGVLYVVATPIGNLKDITIRAVEILQGVDFVVAESTTRALKLLSHFAISKPIVPINSYNEGRKSADITRRLLNGQNCALITGAGTPCISDPGNVTVLSCYESGIQVIAVPGPSAAVAAVSISGLFADHFIFYGFLPIKRGKQKKIFREFEPLSYPVIFYESPRRIRNTLATMLEYFGNRQAAVFKEITKMHERTIRGTLQDIIDSFPENETKGEFVIIVEGKKKLPEETVFPVDK